MSLECATSERYDFVRENRLSNFKSSDILFALLLTERILEYTKRMNNFHPHGMAELGQRESLFMMVPNLLFIESIEFLSRASANKIKGKCLVHRINNNNCYSDL